MRISKADAINIGAVLSGLALYYAGIPIIRNIGGYLFSIAGLVGLYRSWRKIKSQKKEVF